MLSDFALNPSLAAADLGRARDWYAGKLGIRPVLEAEGLLFYRLGSALFSIYQTTSAGTAKNTVAVWNVADLRAEMARLRALGVVFEEYDLGDFRTVDGVATEPGDGGLNAWFKDSEGNLVSLVQIPGDTREPAISAMLAASDLGRAKAWYAEKLGFQPQREYEGELLKYRSGNQTFSVYETPSAGTAMNTVGVWRVDNMRAEMRQLRSRGVIFEEYDLGDARTVDGILTDDDGDMIAWLKDSEGNVLGLAEDRKPIPVDAR